MTWCHTFLLLSPPLRAYDEVMPTILYCTHKAFKQAARMNRSTQDKSTNKEMGDEESDLNHGVPLPLHSDLEGNIAHGGGDFSNGNLAFLSGGDDSDDFDAIVRMDQEARHHNALEEAVTTASNNRRRWIRELGISHFLCHRLYCKYIFPLCVVIGATLGIMIAAGYDFHKETLPPFLVDWIYESRNGWDDTVAADIPKWEMPETSAAGGSSSALIQLEVINGLDDSWQSYFDQTLQDWNQGDPANIVELSVTKLDRPVPNCDFVRGKIMMCNGDYGATDFHGMNHILVYGSTITASLAKLNEYYMKDASRARKQYTICHGTYILWTEGAAFGAKSVPM